MFTHTPTVLSQQRESDLSISRLLRLDHQVDLRYNPGVQFKPVWTTNIAVAIGLMHFHFMAS